MWFESTLSQFHCMSFIQHKQEDFADTHIPLFVQQSFFVFSNQNVFWDFSRIMLIRSLHFFFHIRDRWRNSVRVSVPMVLFFWKYCGIFLPLLCHVRPIPSASLASCTKRFHCLTTQSKDFPFLWWDFATWNHIFLWRKKKKFLDTFPLPHSDFIVVFHIPSQSSFFYGAIPSFWSFFLLFPVLPLVLL